MRVTADGYRINDPFAVDLLPWYITRKLRDGDTARFDAITMTSHQFA